MDRNRFICRWPIWVKFKCFLIYDIRVDIFLNFFMAYYDESEDIVDIRKKIACRYV